MNNFFPQRFEARNRLLKVDVRIYMFARRTFINSAGTKLMQNIIPIFFGHLFGACQEFYSQNFRFKFVKVVL